MQKLISIRPFTSTLRIMLCLVFSLIFFGGRIFAADDGAQLIAFHTNVRLDNKIVKKTVEFTIQINTKSGNRYSKISIPFESYEKINIAKTELWNRDGKRVDKFKEKDYLISSDISQGAFYEDRKRMELDINYNEYPYQITVSYSSTSSEFLALAYWVPTLFESLPCKSATLTVNVSDDINLINYPISIREPISEKEDDRVTYIWSYDNYTPRDEQINSIWSAGPILRVYSQDFHFGEDGSLESWATFGDWQSRLLVGLDDLTLSEKEKIHTLIDTITVPRSKINKLYRYMQANTHYIYLSQDIGGLKPLPASFVCEKKYGDCKALTNYMKAMLKEIGITSHYTIVRAGSTIRPLDTAAIYSQFNHVILAIPLDNDTIWLENTSNCLPPGYISTFTQGRKALLVDGMNSKMVNTPSLEHDDVFENHEWDIVIHQGGNATAKYDAFVKGDSYEKYQYYKTQLTSDKLKKEIQSTLPCNSCELIDFTFQDVNDAEAIIHLEADIAYNDLVKLFGNRIIANPLRLLEDIEHIKIDTLLLSNNIPYPINKRIKYHFEVADSAYIPSAIEELEIKSEFGTFSSKMSGTNIDVNVLLTLKINKGEILQDEYIPFINFLNQIDNYLETNRLQWKK